MELKLNNLTASIFLAVLLVSCASDPLTKSLKEFGYVPAIPAPATQHIGDIYDTADLRNPYALIRDLFATEENEAFMVSLRDDVSIPDSSGESQFKIGAEADIVGKTKTELSAYGANKFKVKFGGVSQYIISKTRLEGEVYPKILAALPNHNFDKKYVVVALLHISTLEYEFYSESGGKIDISPGSEIEKILKAKIGADWSANQNNNLSINSPRFIGYRLARLTVPGFVNLKIFSSGNFVIVNDIPLEDLRNSAR